MSAPSGSLGYLAVAAVAIAVVAGLFALGSPAEERSRRTDFRRVRDLQDMAAATDVYWTRHARLPASVDELMAEPGVTFSANDPATAEPYEYLPGDSIRYEVCGRFELASEELSRNPSRNIWAHGPGRQCFALEAKDLNDEENR